MCVTDRHDMTLAVKVALNLNTTKHRTHDLWTTILRVNHFTIEPRRSPMRSPLNLRSCLRFCLCKQSLNAIFLYSR